METLPRWASEARSRWRYTGKDRPAIARIPGPGEQSVWDFPRPPAIEPVEAEVCIRAAGSEIARSTRCLRVLETGSPPTYYVPVADVACGLLAPTARRSRCEWKGEAHYWDLELAGHRRPQVAWSYPAPFFDFERLRDHFSFYSSRVDCLLDSVPVLAQPSDFYGGWITPGLTGPFKGEPGTDSL